MLARGIQARLVQALEASPVVALLGPRQVGKTTLAHQVGDSRPSVYLDLALSTDRAKLSDPEAYLAAHADELVILDEAHRAPEIFPPLRGLIARRHRRGMKPGRFLLLAPASVDRLQRSGVTLAGRIAYLELAGLNVLEAPDDAFETLWTRGGFPASFLMPDDAASLRGRQDLIAAYLERDMPHFGPRMPTQTLRRFWTMLAHNQGELLNSAHLARALGVDCKTVARYLDLFVDLLLVRRLPSWRHDGAKRLVKSPKVYVRDSGVVHALLGLASQDEVLGHPVAGGSWEGFVIESLLAAAPRGTQASFYRTAVGAEVDLILDLPGDQIWAVAITRSAVPRLGRGFHQACLDLNPTRRFVVYNGRESYPVRTETQAMRLRELAAMLAERSTGAADPPPLQVDQPSDCR